MEYFNQIQRMEPPKVPESPVPAMRLMVERVEQRAMETIEKHSEVLAEMAQEVITDPYGDQSPKDSGVWLRIFAKAKIVSYDLYAVLLCIRGTGAIAVPDRKWRWVIQPILGPNAWETIQQYNETKALLNGFRDAFVKILSEV
jgi:hypothetical protein